MRFPRVVVATSVAVLVSLTAVWAATQNALPKYDASGNLVDSAVREVNGKVGIGTNSPSARLHIAGTVTSPWQSYGELMVAHNVATIPAATQEIFGGIVIGRDKPTALSAGDSLGGINFAAGPDAGEVRGGYAAMGALRGTAAGSGVLAFFTSPAGAVPTERMRIGSSGAVGIGTKNPNAKLHVVGGTVTSPWQSYGELMVAHNVSTIPSGAMEMFGGITIGRDKATALSAGDSLGGINFGAGPDGGEVRPGYAAIGALRGSAGNTGLLTFYTSAASNTPLERLRIETNGNVGIGTATPASKLHVAGDVTVSGNIAAKYQDVAEWVDAASPLEAGTVVVIRKSVRNGVDASRQPYDEAVAGVISAQPGVVLGERGPGKVLVAQSGRVRVKVDAGTAGIEPGDLLVTSATTGYAMKSKPLALGGASFHRPGTVLGKALEPLRKGKGEILVLLTLQ